MANKRKFPETDYDPSRLKETAPNSSSMPKQHTKQATPQATPNVKLDEGPSINARTYSRDRSMLETREDVKEQPDAFSGGGNTMEPASQEMTRKK